MKLAAIYNVWDGVELLKGSIDCIKGHVDTIIIVHQHISNFGEMYDPLPEIDKIFDSHLTRSHECLYSKYIPSDIGGALNEKQKRNRGLEIARSCGCTHFIHLDCDEYYKNFAEAKQMYIQSGAAGSVCKLFTYFKEPEYRFAEPDNYFVPFIHRLNENTVAGVKYYPFYVDPTRKINEENVIELPIFMHHFSYVRKNIDRKINNSSAKRNILKSTVMEDYNSKALNENPEGFFVRFFEQKLTVVDNYFNIQIK